MYNLSMSEKEEKQIIAKTLTAKFITVNDEESAAFTSVMKRIDLAKGELLVNQGDIAKGIFWIHTGLLRQFYYKDGRDISEHFASEGQGMMCIKSMFNKVPSELMIEALEKSVVYILFYNDLINLADKYPVFHSYLRKLLEYVLIVSQEKADSWRFETAKERYNRFIREFPEVAKRASVNHIASYLLMTPESLSRVRSGVL